MLLCKELIKSEDSPPHNYAAHNNILMYVFAVLADVSVL